MAEYMAALPPNDTVSALEFSPNLMLKNFLVAGSCDNSVRCWEVLENGALPRSMQTMGGPVLDVSWSEDGTQVFVASVDCQVKLWDLASNQVMQVAAHNAAVSTCHVARGTTFTCLMTGSWDKTLKFWDTRTPHPMRTINLPERCYCADLIYPVALVGTADCCVSSISLYNGLIEHQESTLRCQHRSIRLFKNANNVPNGFALGGIMGRVAIEYADPANPGHSQQYTFRCHQRMGQLGYQDIYAVNDIAVHPMDDTTIATVGSDGIYSFWDTRARTQLWSSQAKEQSITKCCFDASGETFAYAVGYDWSKGYEYFDPTQKPQIWIRQFYKHLLREPGMNADNMVCD